VTQQVAPKALHLSVHVAPEDSFGVTSTLILGRTEAILIDTQYHVSEALKLADEIAASGTRLKAVFITHPDVDHYLGSAVIRQRFPTTPIYMTAAALAHFDATAARKLAGAKTYAPAQTPDALPQPQVLPQDRLTIDGEAVEIIPDLQGDVLEQTNSFVWIPSLRAVIAGDIVFDGAHTYLADSTTETRREWRRSIDRIASFKPAVVVAGHKKTPGNPESPTALTFTRAYLDAFDAARRSASTPDELTAAMKKKFPDAAYEYLLLASARKAFAPDPAPQVAFPQVIVPDPQGRD
jgi:glyoxylase-like metal-dependent hydrolase (beta-lactamase superfamily II)